MLLLKIGLFFVLIFVLLWFLYCLDMFRFILIWFEILQEDVIVQVNFGILLVGFQLLLFGFCLVLVQVVLVIIDNVFQCNVLQNLKLIVWYLLFRIQLLLGQVGVEVGLQLFWVKLFLSNVNLMVQLVLFRFLWFFMLILC